ncbi:Protein OS-9 [Elasticomyces elasticus]|nr:Protein OS-9 [Elasticomyces elasticus]
MKHFLALPALLRAPLLLAAASQNSFSPNDDLLAFPQFEVKFTDTYLSELDAQSKLSSNDQLNLQTQSSSGHQDDLSQIQRYEGTLGEGRPKDEIQQQHEYMVLDGQRYICSIPQIAPPPPAGSAGAANDTLTKLEEQKALELATERGWELLSAMQNNCVYFISGWWSYRFCYGGGVKQFHQLPPSRGVPVYPPVEDPTVAGYMLGSYQTVEGGTGGDDKEGSAHEAEASDVNRALDFHCNPSTSDRISLIKETSTCAYLMVIQTPRLCNDVAFLPPQKDQPNEIYCAPVIADEEVEDYEHDLRILKHAQEDEAAEALGKKNARAAGTLDGDSAPTEAYPDTKVQIVGDIRIGAHQLVPAGTKIEKSAIVGGGKETYIDTIASSDGKVLGDEAIKKLGLGSPEAVAKLRKELERVAGGERWKLDVIDTPRGREYRGIIGDEDEEKKEGEKGKGVKGKKAKSADAKAGDGSASEGEESEGEGEAEQEGSEEEYYKEEL